MKTKFTLLIVLQMIFLSSVMANEVEFKDVDNYDHLCIVHVDKEKVYDAVCVTDKEFKKIQVIEQKDGYRLVNYKNQKLVYLQPTYLQIPNNNCEKGKIPLFIQP